MIKVGDGNTAEVFLPDETKVLKLFKTGMDESLAMKDLNSCAECLSKLHDMMFQCEIKNNEWPDYKEKITSLPSSQLLCHGDFHPVYSCTKRL